MSLKVTGAEQTAQAEMLSTWAGDVPVCNLARDAEDDFFKHPAIRC